MILHSDPLVGICFGDSRDSIDLKLLSILDSESIYEDNKDLKNKWLDNFLGFAEAQKLLRFDNLILLKQTHSNYGYSVNDVNLDSFCDYRKEGDFLITNSKNTGLAILTADCLSIVFYDSYSHSIGACHAGWKGSVKEVAKNTVTMMQEKFHTKLENLKIFFGPSAKTCCYEVGDHFKNDLKNLDIDYYKKTIIENGGKVFFNLPLFNKLQLQRMGINKESFHSLYNSCTICNEVFCSYRRDKHNSSRQFTIISLK